jgi:hypothetical protein
MPPCDFVMRRLESKDDKVFGTPRLVEAWRDAILSNPLAYLKHRATFMSTFLGRDVLLIPVLDLNLPSRQVHVNNPLFMAMIKVQAVLQPTWVLSIGFWLVIAIGVCAFAWPMRATPAGAFALGATGSSVIYVLSFLPFGVAADFRYGYWCVLASLTGAVVVLAGHRAATAVSADPVPA